MSYHQLTSYSDSGVQCMYNWPVIGIDVFSGIYSCDMHYYVNDLNELCGLPHRPTIVVCSQWMLCSHCDLHWSSSYVMIRPAMAFIGEISCNLQLEYFDAILLDGWRLIMSDVKNSLLQSAVVTFTIHGSVFIFVFGER